MKPLSRYVIWGLGFQPRCSPVFSSSTTAFRAMTYRTGRAQGWGWGSISRGKLWNDMADIYTAGTRSDHYEIIRLLGHGGMSHVYLAEDLHNQQKVVLKFPNDDLIGNVGVFERYKREAEIGSRLNHPNVQRLLNTGEERSEHYLVMEYLQGCTLREVLEKCAPGLLPTDEALRITIQICDALAYCHEHGVFHRDIKPENIMILNDGNIKIIDFGVAN